MPNKCVVCSGKEKPLDCLSFHRFPENVKRKKQWLMALNLEKANKWACVCSRHFKQSDYITSSNSKRNVLKPTATPSLAEGKDMSSPVPITSHRLVLTEEPTKRKLFVQSNIYEGPSTSKHCIMTIPSPTRSHSINIEPLPEATSVSPSSSRTLSVSSRTLTASEDGSPILRQLQEGLPLDRDTSETMSLVEIDSSSPERNENEKWCLKSKEMLHQTSSSFTTSEGTIISIEAANITEPPQKKRKLTKKRYIGDITSSDLATPRKAKRSFNMAKERIKKYRRKVDILQRQNRRIKSRVNSLKSLLIHLKTRNFITENAYESIEASLPGPAADIVNRILKGSRSEKYSSTLRAFALTLHFYSPRAYNYVREKFNKSLPHPSTVSKWYQKIDGASGFTKEALTALKQKVLDNESKGKKTFVNLVLDEMSIRKKIEWVGDKFLGYIDIGTKVEADSLPEAKEVLVFLVTSVNGNWKLPVGYFFLNGLSGNERANLVNTCLEFLQPSGVQVTSLTFDGASANINMAKQLGVNLENVENLQTYFYHPVTKEKIFIFFDICHMVKLIRNCLGDMKLLKTSSSKTVSWEYLQKLVYLQIKEGLHAGSKIKRRHIEFAREKMRVKIATQTFSKSVCDALLFLEEDLKLDDFKGAGETAKFCLLMNDVFDILNSRNKFSSYQYKKALSSCTEKIFFDRFNDLKEYIIHLYLNGVSVIAGPRKTGFLGFLIGMESFKNIYNKYVKNDKQLEFVLGYKFSQDHLETFFSAVRSLHGFNNNPTCRQFQSAYKKLLIAKEVRGADTANAITLDNTLILNVSSRKITVNDEKEDMENSEDFHKLCDELKEQQLFSSTGWHLSDFINDVVIYIAGFVVRALKKCVTCAKCLSLLETNEVFSFLQKRKTFGNLVRASPFVNEICKFGERIFREMGNKIFFKYKFNILDFLINRTLAALPHSTYDKFGSHIFDGELIDNHQLSLIKLILKHYFTVRLHHETRRKSDEVSRVRSMFTHLILYKNQ